MGYMTTVGAPKGRRFYAVNTLSDRVTYRDITYLKDLVHVIVPPLELILEGLRVGCQGLWHIRQ